MEEENDLDIIANEQELSKFEQLMRVEEVSGG